MKIIPIILLTLAFTQCASVPSNNNMPFNVTKTNLKESLKEDIVTIEYTSTSSITFLELFFRGRKTSLQQEGTTLVGVFNKLKNRDLQLHGDAKKEFGNRPSKKQLKLPFKLTKNEAAISYKEGEETKYYTIENIH